MSIKRILTVLYISLIYVIPLGQSAEEEFLDEDYEIIQDLEFLESLEFLEEDWGFLDQIEDMGDDYDE